MTTECPALEARRQGRTSQVTGHWARVSIAPPGRPSKRQLASRGDHGGTDRPAQPTARPTAAHPRGRDGGTRFGECRGHLPHAVLRPVPAGLRGLPLRPPAPPVAAPPPP